MERISGWPLQSSDGTHWVGPKCVTEAFSTTCAEHVEDCEGWWLVVFILCQLMCQLMYQSFQHMPILRNASLDMAVDKFFYFGGANFGYISLAAVCCALCALPFT